MTRLRRCAGCGKSREKTLLARFVEKEGLLTFDKKAIFKGRGVYLCIDRQCCYAAYKNKSAFSKALRKVVKAPDKEELWRMIKYDGKERC